MASPTDLDIFTRSQSGDRRARTELYKKFFRDNSRVSRLAEAYPDPTEFLHDCFTNFLRTSHSWQKDGTLSHWVETVVIWTSLQNDRRQDIADRCAKGQVRMCAEVEGEDVTRGETLAAYAPPFKEAGDSPAARLLSLLAEPEKAAFRKRAIENGTWEETAAAAGKPVNSIGPIFARAVNRLVRLFGAPPPMDDDLVPVFARAAEDPQKPDGRVISQQLDPPFYGMPPGLQKIGLTTTYDVRILTLWETAGNPDSAGEDLRHHFDQCQYCADLHRALIQLRQALVVAAGVEFHLCPGSFTLSNASDPAREAFDLHLSQCSICRAERTRVLEGETQRQARDEDAAEQTTAGAGRKMAWVAAALVLAVASFGGYRYLANRGGEAPKAASADTGEHQAPTVMVDPRYRDLVQNVPIDDARIMASVHPENRRAVKYSIDQFSLGQVGGSLEVTSQLAAKGTDPGVSMIYAMSLYYTHLMTDGYHEMLKSEAMAPRDSFRCWIMFQFSLMVGDRKVVDREAEHLANDPEYKDKVKKVMDIVRQRG